MESVWAVVVTYNPLTEDFLMLIDALIGQVDHVVVVDNASTLDVRRLIAGMPISKIEIVVMPENLGLAAAQNVGLRMAQVSGVSYAILFDQDSIPDAGMVETLLGSLIKLQLADDRVIAVGPNYLGAGLSPFRRLEGLTIRKCSCIHEHEQVPVDFLISSGCLISLDMLAEVGEMKEELFIDYIDVEWGLRALRQGYRMFGICAATMKHRIGDAHISRFGVVAPMHSPLRHYYQIRNGLWVFRQPGVLVRWKIAGITNLFLKFCFYLIFSAQRLAQLRMMVLGARHGLAGKLGHLS
jgi:rhamnosyltransferase